MAVLSSARPRLVAAGRWLAPSVVAACTGTLAAGLVEGRVGDGALAVAAATGFLGLVAIPALLALGIVARALIAGWQPAAMRAALVDDAGGAPRLAGWIAVVLLGALALAAAMFQGTWLLASWTAFKPLTLGFVQPMIAVATTLALLAGSRPAARLLGWGFARLDAWWRHSRPTGRGTLLRPGSVLGAGALLALGGSVAIARFVVLPRVGPLDLAFAYAPGTALAAAVVTHLAWARAGRRARAAGGAVAIALALATVGVAVAAVWARPSLTLQVWGDQPVSGYAIERIFDLDRIRSAISLAEFRPLERAGAPHPDIVLITIDTVRADRTPPYGGPAEMPVLRALGERGTVFVHAYAPSNVTRRSIPSMITGLMPTRIRGRVVGWALRLDPRHVLLAERLRAGGYETAGFMCCKGFWGREARTGLQRGLETVAIEQNGVQLAKQARAWLDARERRGPGRPLFLWMHILEPHDWITAGGSIATDADRRRLYDRSLALTDTMLRDVLGAFDARPPDRQPIAIITADHGEALGDHGAPYHSTDLYDSNIRVPFVIAGPGIRAQRIAETVSLTDLTPTVLELAGFVPPTGVAIDGRPQGGLATGARAAQPEGGEAFAAMIRDRSSLGGVTAIVRGRWKLLATRGGLELYDVRADPGERTNLIGQHPGIAGELERLLEAKRARSRQPAYE